MAVLRNATKTEKDKALAYVRQRLDEVIERIDAGCQVGEFSFSVSGGSDSATVRFTLDISFFKQPFEMRRDQGL